MHKYFFSAILAAAICEASFAGHLFDVDVKMEPLGKLKAELEQQAAQMSPEEKAMMQSMGLDPAAQFAPMSMRVSIQDERSRLEYLKKFMFFAQGTYMLGGEKDTASTFVNPLTKTYADFDAKQMASHTGQQVTYGNVKASFEDNLGAKTLLGYPVKLSRLDVRYTQTTAGRVMMGMKTQPRTESVHTVWEVWSTAKLPFSVFETSHAPFYQTGDEAVDAKIREAVGNAIGMPLAWSAMQRDPGGAETMRISGEVKTFESKTFPASHFAIPEGYRKQSMMEMLMAGGF
jgi:hypothetical protein